MKLKMAFAQDPVDRYSKLVAAGGHIPELSPQSFEKAITATPGEDEVAVLSTHLAEHSNLTLAQAKPVVKSTLDKATAEGKTDPKAKAAAVSEAASKAAGISANVELSDPVMLEPQYRMGFAVLMVAAFGACIGCITALGDESSAQEGALIGLTVLGVLALLAVLVLVMGYKNVKISGGQPGGGGS